MEDDGFLSGAVKWFHGIHVLALFVASIQNGSQLHLGISSTSGGVGPKLRVLL